jgi:hypothetical protein
MTYPTRLESTKHVKHIPLTLRNWSLVFVLVNESIRLCQTACERTEGTMHQKIVLKVVSPKVSMKWC